MLKCKNSIINGIFACFQKRQENPISHGSIEVFYNNSVIKPTHTTDVNNVVQPIRIGSYFWVKQSLIIS